MVQSRQGGGRGAGLSALLHLRCWWPLGASSWLTIAISEAESVFSSWASAFLLFKKNPKIIYIYFKKYEHKSGHNKWRNLQRVIFLYEILYIISYIKKSKSVEIWRSEICIPRSTCLLFLCNPEFFVFEIEILHIYATIHWLCHDFFLIFWNT
jgi:hypothetical protein